MAASTQTDANAAYPPQNSLQAALQNRQAMDSLATVQLGEASSDAAPHQCRDHAHATEDEAMRLRGGCFSLAPCGCPDCDCCIIPCTIS